VAASGEGLVTSLGGVKVILRVYVGNWHSLNVAPTLWLSDLGLTREAQYLGIMQQHLSSSEGDRVDWDVALIDRYGPRRSSI